MWNGEFYCNYGHGDDRSWSDAVQFGFVSAGGGPWDTRTLRLLEPGCRVWVRVPGRGFVGVARVTDRVQPATAFNVVTPEGDVPVLDAVKDGNYNRQFMNNPDRCEQFVRVKWLQTVPLERAVNDIGLFFYKYTVLANQPPQNGLRRSSG